MELIIKKTIGKEVYTFVVKGENLFEVVQESRKLSFQNVTNCGLCGGNNLFLNSRLAQKKFKYVMIQCASCGGSVTFGTKMEDPNTFFLRKENNDLKWVSKIEQEQDF